jgi:membrane peptidoglycan carboxypeptidase
MLASDGLERPPYVVRPPGGTGLSLGLTPAQLEGLRRAMISVVQSGTARGAGRFTTVTIAGKTGTAQNPHGPAHGWFIGFAPADKPEIVVGAIVEFAREGPYVAPLVARVIARYLGADSTAETELRMTLPTDTAPRPRRLLPGATEDSTPSQFLTPPPDSAPPQRGAPPEPGTPPDTSHATAVPGTR